MAPKWRRHCKNPKSQGQILSLLSQLPSFVGFSFVVLKLVDFLPSPSSASPPPLIPSPLSLINVRDLSRWKSGSLLIDRLGLHASQSFLQVVNYQLSFQPWKGSSWLRSNYLQLKEVEALLFTTKEIFCILSGLLQNSGKEGEEKWPFSETLMSSQTQ